MGSSDTRMVEQTAYVAAHVRKHAGIEYADEIALDSDIESAFREFDIGEERRTLVGFAPLIEAKWLTINQAVESRDYRNVLEIAVGLSPRGLVMTTNPDVTFVASDLKRMIGIHEREVRRVLKDSSEERSNYHFREVDVLEEDQIRAAIEVFDSKPVAVISEGFFPYLSKDQKSRAFGNIWRTLRSSGGALIACDITTKSRIKGYMNAGPEIDRVIKAISGSTSRDLYENSFDDEAELERMIQGVGFVSTRLSQEDVMHLLQSPAKLEIDETKIRDLLKDNYVWCLSAKV